MFKKVLIFILVISAIVLSACGPAVKSVTTPIAAASPTATVLPTPTLSGNWVKITSPKLGDVFLNNQEIVISWEASQGFLYFVIQLIDCASCVNNIAKVSGSGERAYNWKVFGLPNKLRYNIKVIGFPNINPDTAISTSDDFTFIVK
jgi:hypothetical protein